MTTGNVLRAPLAEILAGPLLSDAVAQIPPRVPAGPQPWVHAQATTGSWSELPLRAPPWITWVDTCSTGCCEAHEIGISFLSPGKLSFAAGYDYGGPAQLIEAVS